MAITTQTPGTLQPPSSVVTQAPAQYSESAQPESATRIAADEKKAGVQDDYFLVQSSGDSAVLTGQAVYLRHHNRPSGPAHKLREWFNPNIQQLENTAGVEIVLAAAAANIPQGSGKSNYASIRPPVNLENQAPIANWQKVIDAHARHDAEGHAIDDGGKRIDITHMNAAFGEKLAQICEKLDSEGYAGKYEIISGVRSKEEQQLIYTAYKKAGSSHPVALPGSSLHELGCAVDIKCIGGNSVNFFDSYHQAALQAGCALVANDKEHVQLPRNQVHDFIMQQQGPHFQTLPYEIHKKHNTALDFNTI